MSTKIINQVTPIDETSPLTLSTNPEISGNDQTTVEELRISGSTLSQKIKELIHQGNIHRISIKNENGNLLLEIPITFGVIGGIASIVLIPEILAISAIGAMFAHLTVVVERRESRPSHNEK